MASSPEKRAPKIVLTGSKNFNDWLMRTTDLLILAECFEFADATAVLPRPPRNPMRMAIETPPPPPDGSASGNQGQQVGDDELQAAARETLSPQGTAQGQNNNQSPFSSFSTLTPRRSERQVVHYGSAPAAQGDPLNQDPITKPLFDVDDENYEVRYDKYVENFRRRTIMQSNVAHTLINTTLNLHHRQRF
jgi:hypothetical protein